jgi:hypothetical protein
MNPKKNIPTVAATESDVCVTLQYNKADAYKKKTTSGTAMCVRVSFSKIGFLNKRFVPLLCGLIV